MAVKKRTRAIRGLVVIGVIMIAITFAVRGVMLQVKLNRRAKEGISDFCDYLKEDFGEVQSYTYNHYQRPIVDFQNKLYICVTPKAGITKIQAEFRDWTQRKTGSAPKLSYVNDEVAEFKNVYGDLQESVPASNWTKVFIYRNPADRLISLYLDKFDPKRIREAWVSTKFVRDYNRPDFDLLLNHLEYYAINGLRDPHIWPQVEYCSVGTTEYDMIMDIDDHSTLTKFFSVYWGDVNFESSTKHATKAKVEDDVRTLMRKKIHIWRDEFMRTYGQDVKFYCDQQRKKPNPDRTI